MSATPTDGGTNLSSPVEIAPPAGISKGDLVVFVISSTTRSGLAAGSISVLNSGGQTLTQIGGANATSGSDGQHLAQWYCEFNGTWTSNPQFSFTGDAGTTKTGACFVFKKKFSSALHWTRDGTQTFSGHSLPTSPNYTFTGAAKTTTLSNTLVICAGTSLGPNGWTNPASGWTLAGYTTNTAGDGATIFLLFKLQSAIGSSGSPSIDQTAPRPYRTRSFTNAFQNYGLKTGFPLYFFNH